MQKILRDPDPYEDFPWPPTEDDLPYSDGLPMESERHVFQMYLLIEVLRLAWAERNCYVGGDMFVYYSPAQVLTEDFRGPDVLVALDVQRRERKSWVVWQEGKAPDVVIELLSYTTATSDKTVKKQIYQDMLRIPEYFWYHPFTGELAGFTLQNGNYQPITLDAAGRMPSERLGLTLVHWDGEYNGVAATWLRWASADGTLLPTPAEVAEQERQRAEQAMAEAEAARRRIAELEARLSALEGSQDAGPA